MTNGAEQHTGMNWAWWGKKKVWKYKIGVFLYGSDSFPSTLYESWTEWEEVRGDACGCFMNSAVQKIQFEWTGNIPTPFQIFSISVGLPANNAHKIKLPQPVLIKLNSRATQDVEMHHRQFSDLKLELFMQTFIT